MPDEKLLVLDREEYLALIDQKAADWQTITQMSTAFLAFAGALFAAGVGQKAAFVVVLTSVPLLFGVFHMVRNAALQLQMVTYFAVFSPFEGVSWERDINEVRSRFWEQSPKSAWMMNARKKVGDRQWLLEFLRGIEHPSAWHIWLAIALAVGLLASFVPLLADGYKNAYCALALGLAILVVGGLIIYRSINRLEHLRKSWIAEWKSYRDELIENAQQADSTGNPD